METKMIFAIASIILALLALSLIYRVFKGPTVVDRIIAADCIDIILGVIMIVFGCIEEKSIFIDLGFIVTIVGFIGTVLISKYLEGTL